MSVTFPLTDLALKDNSFSCLPLSLLLSLAVSCICCLGPGFAFSATPVSEENPDAVLLW